MKLICTQENFKKAIYNTERVVGKQITLPVLENILLETEQGMLKVSATNLEIGVSLKIGAKIEEEGKVTIPAKLIGNFAANLPAHDTIKLETTNSILKISSGDYHARIKGLSAQEFPIIPEPESDFLFSLPAQELKNAISRIIVCASADNTRPELTGVNMLLFDKEIHLAATDSFRLAEAIIPIEQKRDQEYSLLMGKMNSIIVPAQTFSEILRVADDEAQKIKISVEENQIFFQVGAVRIVSRLINGKYPEYKHIIPQKFATEAYINKEDLARAVKIASVFTNSKAGEVKIGLDAKNKKVTVQSQSEEAGENQTQIAADISGPNQEIVFNPRYILDGINSVASFSVALFVNSGSAPALLRMTGGKGEVIKNYTYVVMPIKN